MAIYRDTGAVAHGTYLIDSVIWGIKKQHAVYIVKSSKKTALIDTGVRRTTKTILNSFQKLHINNLDLLLITHSHADHCAAIHLFAREFPDLEIGIPSLAYDLQTIYNRKSEKLGLSNPIRLLKEGDLIELDSKCILEVIHTPGHISDHISFLDRQKKLLFVGDACGAHHLGKDFTRPTAYAPDFNHEDYINTLQRFQEINPVGLAIASYGFATNQDAKNCIDASIRAYHEWKKVVIEAIRETPNEEYVARVLLKKFGRSPGEISENRPDKWVQRILRGLARGFISSLGLMKD